jgi:hypothetical protein
MENNSWQFTDSDKNGIRLILRREASRKKVDTFIIQLEWLCTIKMGLLKQQSKADIRNTRECILTDCKTALSHMRKVELGKLDLAFDGSMDCFVGRVHDPNASFGLLMICMASEAVKPLEKFVKVLEEYHQSEVKRIGRNPADSDHFVRQVGDLYIEHIGKKPTTYVDGCFSNLVKKVLGILQLPCEDPSKSIRAAVKEI